MEEVCGKCLVQGSALRSPWLSSIIAGFGPLDEIKALVRRGAARLPILPEALTAPTEQQSWRAFERIFGIIQNQGLPTEISVAQYRAWLARYPQEQSLYPAFWNSWSRKKTTLPRINWSSDYRKQFPDDEIFPVKAKAMVEYRQGSLQQGLAVYEQTFQPLWAPELVKSYFDLLTQTQSLRKFVDQARAALAPILKI